MKRRTRAGMIVLVMSACVSASYQLGYIAVTQAPEDRSPVLVAAYDRQRYAGLAVAVPPNGVIGYLTDDPDGPEATKSYFLTQYVLAPCLFVKGDRQPLVLVDDPPGREVRPEMIGRRLLRDLGNGVRLFGREGSR